MLKTQNNYHFVWWFINGPNWRNPTRSLYHIAAIGDNLLLCGRRKHIQTTPRILVDDKELCTQCLSAWQKLSLA
jgi:hypothetical protein